MFYSKEVLNGHVEMMFFVHSHKTSGRQIIKMVQFEPNNVLD